MHLLFTLPYSESTSLCRLLRILIEIWFKIKVFVLFLELLLQVIVHFGSLHALHSFSLLELLRLAILWLCFNLTVPIIWGTSLIVVVSASSILIIATLTLLKLWLFVSVALLVTPTPTTVVLS